MVDFSAYQPPGVFVEETASTLVSVGGVNPSVVAVVGPSIGYRTATETVTLTGTDAVSLSNLGINLATGFVVQSASGVTYAATDYTLTAEAGEDGDISETADNTTTIARSGASTIGDGDTVYVTYRYTDTTYFQALRATDLDQVSAVYGEALDLTTNAIISPLTFAAKFAFDNGAAEVVCVATTGSASLTTIEELAAAYAVLNTEPDANLVVPLPVGISGTDAVPGNAANVGAGLLTFIQAQEALGIYRVGIVGMEKTVTIDPSSLVDSYRSKRMMHAYPNRMNYYNGASNTTIEVPGYYLAAAYAGRFAANVVAKPLTKERVRGFSGIPATVLSTMTASQKNSWSNLGVAVTELTQSNTLLVRHGTSTDRSSVVTREVSIVRARDALVNLLQSTLDSSGLIGSYITTETTTRIAGVIEGILETAKYQEYIVDYSDVKVRQISTEPSVIEVKFRYKPAYPLNYIVVSFSVNTETGETSLTTAA